MAIFPNSALSPGQSEIGDHCGQERSLRTAIFIRDRVVALSRYDHVQRALTVKWFLMWSVSDYPRCFCLSLSPPTWLQSHDMELLLAILGGPRAAIGGIMVSRKEHSFIDRSGRLLAKLLSGPINNSYRCSEFASSIADLFMVLAMA